MTASPQYLLDYNSATTTIIIFPRVVARCPGHYFKTRRIAFFSQPYFLPPQKNGINNFLKNYKNNKQKPKKLKYLRKIVVFDSVLF